MNTNIKRVMPERLYLGQMYNGPITSATRWREREQEGRYMFAGVKTNRSVMGLILPEWQRGFVWTRAQCASFIESLWRGVPVGTYSVNLIHGSRFDGYLIDGQQRMTALEKYLNDDLEVFGYFYSEVTEIDRRFFDQTVWPYYETRSDDEAYLRDYYNRLNFGGTAHKEEDRA